MTDLIARNLQQSSAYTIAINAMHIPLLVWAAIVAVSCQVSAQQLGPDLSPVAMSSTKSEINLCEDSSQIRVSIQNVGDRAVRSSGWTDLLVLSRTPTVNATQSLEDCWISKSVPCVLGSNRYCASCSGVNRIVTEPGEIREHLYSIDGHFPERGPFFLVAITDTWNEIPEWNELNNTAAVSLLGRSANLSVSKLLAPEEAAPGDYITVSWTVENTGNGYPASFLYGPNWGDNLYVSTDATLDSGDHQLGSFHFSVCDPPYRQCNQTALLAPGSSYEATRANGWFLPWCGEESDTCPPGDYYLIVRVDSSTSPNGNLMCELDEEDNYRAVPIRILPRRHVLTFAKQIRTKMFINAIPEGGCDPYPVLGALAPLERVAAYMTLCHVASWLREDPLTGSSYSPLDARVLAIVDLEWTCYSANRIPIDGRVSAVTSLAGMEGWLEGSANPITVIDNIAVDGTWNFVASGHPHPAAEVGFQVLRPRGNTNIWHEVSGSITCEDDGFGRPESSLSIQFSKTTSFPSHRSFIYSLEETEAIFERIWETVPQQAFSNLWFLPGVGWPYFPATLADLAPSSECPLQPPSPPKPTPSDFDWAPLATEWCNQLADCGLDVTGCRESYLAAIERPVAASPFPPPDDIVNSSGGGILRFSCKDSVEADSGHVECAPEPSASTMLVGAYTALWLVGRARTPHGRRGSKHVVARRAARHPRHYRVS